MVSPVGANATNWISATGQVWKLYLAVAGFAGSLICFGAAVLGLIGGGEQFVGLTLGGIFLCVVTFMWLTAVLCCPHCRARLVWTMVTTRPHSSWLIDLAALHRCPVCNRALNSLTSS